jgi:hypothetical protein
VTLRRRLRDLHILPWFSGSPVDARRAVVLVLLD